MISFVNAGAGGLDLSAAVYNSRVSSDIKISNPFQLNKWHHFAFVQRKGCGIFFIDGNLKYNYPINNANKINRTSNFIGKSNWPDVASLNAVVSEFKIYKGVRLPSDIFDEFNQTSKQTYSKYVKFM